MNKKDIMNSRRKYYLHSMFHIYTLGIVLAFSGGKAYGQVVEEWVTRYSGPGGGIYAGVVDMHVDNNGFVYVTGNVYNPGTDYDWATIKYDPNGNRLWVSQENGSVNAQDGPMAMTVDPSGNVYVTGWVENIATGGDAITIKYDQNGNKIWAASYNGPGVINKNDTGRAIALDELGNVYMAGSAAGANAYHDYVTIKYDNNGNQIWAVQYHGPLSAWNFAHAIALDGSGNVIVTGMSSDGIRADSDYGTIKYDQNGNQLWIAIYNETGVSNEEAKALVVDENGNIYVTGNSIGIGTKEDYATVKYDPNGNQIWVARYNASGNGLDGANAIAYDKRGFIYVTGRAYNNGTGDDYTTIKYDTNGNQIWLASYNGTANESDVARSITLDGSGNVYVTGYGTNIDTLTDITTIKYNEFGNQEWLIKYNAPWNDYSGAVAIAVDEGGRVYVAGSSTGGEQTEYLTIKYHQEQPNVLPVANAGLDQTMHVGMPVSLNGSGSSDPDGNTPLSFAWRIASAPMGSIAALANANTVTPSFTPDLPGDYTIELVVRDSLGMPSSPDTILVSTLNTPPVADAGPDQALLQIGASVQLNGKSSYDLDGDSISHLWTIALVPAGSTASLSDPASSAPTFVADKYGTYSFDLVVRDPWAASILDSVTVSFENVRPVANAGVNQTVSVGTAVQMDGAGSTDANSDPLTYAWTMLSKPDNSLATLSNPMSANPTFVADFPGLYIVSLIVNDGMLSSNASNVTVLSVVNSNTVIAILSDAINAINLLDFAAFKNPNMKNTLTNKINAVISDIQSGSYEDALLKLENDILAKIDGCSVSNSPDKNDWITNCTDQGLVYPLIQYAIQIFRTML